MRLLLATRNRGKLAEIQQVLAGLPFHLETLEGHPGLPDAVEDGRTFAENACLKARHFLALTGLPTLAEDSGLEVLSLDGRPGVHSARYAADDASRVERILNELDEIERRTGTDDRRARFVCSICVLFSEGRQVAVEGEVYGRITRRPQGSGGFGYDPVFYYPAAGRTFAEMSREEKNQVSHRGRAFQKLRAELDT